MSPPVIPGLAMLVPLLYQYDPKPADITRLPIAEISGFILPSIVGPLLEKFALIPAESVAPTVITFFAAW